MMQVLTAVSSVINCWAAHQTQLMNQRWINGSEPSKSGTVSTEVFCYRNRQLCFIYFLTKYKGQIRDYKDSCFICLLSLSDQPSYFHPVWLEHSFLINLNKKAIIIGGLNLLFILSVFPPFFLLFCSPSVYEMAADSGRAASCNGYWHDTLQRQCMQWSEGHRGGAFPHTADLPHSGNPPKARRLAESFSGRMSASITKHQPSPLQG